MTESIHHADNSQNAPNNTTICDDDNGAIGLGDELRSNCVNTPSTPATGNTTITETDHPIETIEYSQPRALNKSNSGINSRMSLVLMRVMTVMGIWGRM